MVILSDDEGALWRSPLATLRDIKIRLDSRLTQLQSNVSSVMLFLPCVARLKQP
ncbi:MAG: hypothetical protein KME20_15975 [Kaiparowitsia implicata GSE-PSE-MK54-09C]|jgi:hypothetical protein|nr:hypothetical protein [Kaiparowitsia implicata GSE-PSE-MK54-09C]